MKETFPIVNRRLADAGPPRPMQVITCGVCGREEAISAHAGRATAAHLAGSFAKRGWLVGDVGKHLCPDCWAKRHPKRSPEKEKVEMNKVERSPAAAQKLGELYMILSEAFDAQAKRYKPGWSDQRVAKETGLALDFVAKRRNDDFGPIVVDTSFEDLRRAAETARGNVQAALISLEQAAGRLRASDEALGKILTLAGSIQAKHGPEGGK